MRLTSRDFSEWSRISRILQCRSCRHRLAKSPRLFDISLSKPAVEMLLGSNMLDRGSNVLHASLLRTYFCDFYLFGPGHTCSSGISAAANYRDAVKEALATPFQSRWVFDVELIARFLRSYRETSARLSPLSTRTHCCNGDVDGSKVKLMDGFKAFKDLFDIRRRYRKRLRHSFT